MEDGKIKVLFFGSEDYGICSPSNIVKCNEASLGKLGTKSTLKKATFKRALAGMRAEERKRKLDACFVKLKRLSEDEINNGCKRRKLGETEQRAVTSSPKLRLEDLITKPINIQNLNIDFGKLDPSFRQFLGFNMNITPFNIEKEVPQAKTTQEASSQEFVLPPSEIANFNTIVEWKDYVRDLLASVKNPVQKRLLEGTYNMVEITILLEHALYSDEPNLDYALELFYELKNIWPRVDVSKLQRVPDAMDVIRNACHYVGVMNSVLSDAEAENAMDTVEFIRKHASEIFNSIKVSDLLLKFLDIMFLLSKQTSLPQVPIKVESTGSSEFGLIPVDHEEVI